jgi:putative CRISPR-associated protein (TIGR02619 family)
MSGIILTTCGTSLLESSCWIADDTNLKPISSLSERSSREEMKVQWSNWINLYKDQLIEKFNINCWNNTNMLIDLPAELASLKAIKMYFESSNINRPLSSEDRVILLHSDNHEGIFCAQKLEELIRNKNLLNPSDIERKVIANLNPADRDRFGRALRETLNYARGLRRDNNEVILNLTGGYKALAILLAGFAREKTGIRIFYLHEEAGYDQIYDMVFEPNGDVSSGYFDIPAQSYTQTIGRPHS